MNYNSPKYANKVNPQFRFSDEFKSPFTSPPNHTAQSFSPYSYSSPKNRNRNGGPKRYFNSSTASTNSSNSNGSPFKFNRNNREAYNQNRFSAESANISLYYDPTMMENPWEELEKEWKEKKGLASKLENAELDNLSK